MSKHVIVRNMRDGSVTRTRMPGNPPVAPKWIAERLAVCKTCIANVGGVCMEQKKRTPQRAATILVGVRMAKAHCPLNLWPAAENPEVAAPSP